MRNLRLGTCPLKPSLLAVNSVVTMTAVRANRGSKASSHGGLIQAFHSPFLSPHRRMIFLLRHNWLREPCGKCQGIHPNCHGAGTVVRYQFHSVVSQPRCDRFFVRHLLLVHLPFISSRDILKNKMRDIAPRRYKRIQVTMYR
jgi:hypothetical protein